MKLYPYYVAAALCGGLVFPSASVRAESNLLENALTEVEENLNNKTAFYSVWELYDKDGNRVETENAPYSCFAKVKESWQLDYNTGYITPYSVLSGIFDIGEPVVLLKYPTSETDYNYAIPIEVTEEGDYVLKGRVGYAKYSSSVSKTAFVNKYSVMVVAAVTEPSSMSMAIGTKNDDYYVDMTDTKTGNTVETGYTAIATTTYTEASTFEFPFHLTSDIKYLTFYMPSQLLVLGGLSLEMPGAETTVIALQESDDVSAEPLYYDLQGRLQSNGTLSQGLYIRKTGEKAEKIYIK